MEVGCNKGMSIRKMGGREDGREGRMERGRVKQRLEGRDGHTERKMDGKQVERSTDNGRE